MDTHQPEAGLARRLGVSAATLSGVGIILGAGIYVLVGVAAGEAAVQARASLQSPARWWRRMFSAIWSPAGMTGFRALIGSWKIIEM